MNLKHLKKLSNSLLNLKINPNDICIVGGAVLSIFNIRNHDDIDIIVLSNIRDKICPNDKAFNISKNIEIVGKNWYKYISDNELIKNNKYHFIYKNFKFINIEIIYLKYKYSKRKKHINDFNKIKNLNLNYNFIKEYD